MRPALPFAVFIAFAAGMLASAQAVAPAEMTQLRESQEKAVEKTAILVSQIKNPDSGDARRKAMLAALTKVSAAVEETAALFPDDVPIQDAAFRQAMAAEDWERARRYARGKLTRAESSEDKKGRIVAITALGQVSLKQGDYARATSEAKQALDIDPRDKAAVALYEFAKDRAAPVSAHASPESGTAGASEGAASESARVAVVARVAEHPYPSSFRREAISPPSIGGSAALDPRAPDFWDRQLLGPMTKQSESNPVSRAYLSPLLKEGKVTIRLVRERDAPDIHGSWGDYDLETGVIRYNVDLIDRDIGEYNAYYAKRDPGRRIHAIDGRRPLEPSQVDFLVSRYLPLAVHEAGGHGTNAEDLKTRLGSLAAPLDKDTELIAWRLEAAYVAAERRRQRGYLTEPTSWGRTESDLVAVWEHGRTAGDSHAMESYLDTMGYAYLPRIAGDAGMTQRRAGAVQLVQSYCRHRYDAKCADAVDLLASLLPGDLQGRVTTAERHLASHPEDAKARVELMNHLFEIGVANYRLDPKGVAVVSSYYREQDRKVAELEAEAQPLTLWQRLRKGFLP